MRPRAGLAAATAALVAVAGCGVLARPAPEAPPAPSRPGAGVRGYASWYGIPHHGRRTASGEAFDMHALTAAHRTLPLGTRVHVTNLDNGRAVTVRVNDRGPFVAGRVIDLSYAAALALGAVGRGVVPVRLEVQRRPRRRSGTAGRHRRPARAPSPPARRAGAG